jgi:hypothetical protein
MSPLTGALRITRHTSNNFGERSLKESRQAIADSLSIGSLLIYNRGEDRRQTIHILERQCLRPAHAITVSLVGATGCARVIHVARIRGGGIL